jgi:hypothetical protein
MYSSVAQCTVKLMPVVIEVGTLAAAVLGQRSAVLVLRLFT